MRTLPVMENLPPFPAVALKALSVLSGTETSLRELCDVVRPDPIFSAEILRFANSPLVAFSKEVSSVLQAAMLLGFRQLRKLVITIGLRSYLDSTPARALHSCWHHSVACAMIAERIARGSALDSEFAYTGGILHDIGRVVLATLHPGRYDTSPGSPENLGQERTRFGMDHCQAGALLISAWRLPESLAAITAHHHDPLSLGKDAPEVVRLSCRLADALGFATSPGGACYDLQEVLAAFPEHMKVRLPESDDLAEEIDRQLKVIEAGK